VCLAEPGACVGTAGVRNDVVLALVVLAPRGALLRGPVGISQNDVRQVGEASHTCWRYKSTLVLFCSFAILKQQILVLADSLCILIISLERCLGDLIRGCLWSKPFDALVQRLRSGGRLLFVDGVLLVRACRKHVAC
jgi:hypothetical protein